MNQERLLIIVTPYCPFGSSWVLNRRRRKLVHVQPDPPLTAERTPGSLQAVPEGANSFGGERMSNCVSKGLFWGEA